MTEEDKLRLRQEKVFLSLCIEKPSLIGAVVGVVTHHHFMDNDCSIIWSTLLELYKNGTSIDVLVTYTKIKERKLKVSLEKISRIHAMSSSMIVDAKELETYTDLIIESHQKKEIRLLARDILEELNEGEGNLKDVTSKIKRAYDSIVGEGPGKNHIPMGVLIQEIIQNAKNSEKGIKNENLTKTHLQSLDDKIKGLAGGEVMTIAARPGMGKTELACKVIYEKAVIRKEPVLMINWEVKSLQLAQRLLKYKHDFSESDLRSGRIDEKTLEGLEKDSEMAAAPIYLINGAGLKLEDLASLVRKYVVKYGIKMVFMDYLQLIKSRQRLTGEELISTLSRGVKEVAMENDVPVVLLAQLNREVEKSNDKKPSLQHLKGSGAIEADADIVALIWNTQVAGVNEIVPEHLRNKFILVLAKFRDGKKKDIVMGWENGQIIDSKTQETNGTEEDELPF